jgi:thiol-disulfide isomerase/thioredoxin
MRRRRVLIGGAAVAATAAGAGIFAWRERGKEHEGSTDLASGDLLWPLSFDRPDGSGPLSMGAFRGSPLLVNFWATWCPPCVKELPLLDRFSREQTAWRVLGLAVDQPQPVREFLAKHAVTYPIGMAGLDGIDLARRLGNGGGGLPFSLVLTSAGQVAARKLGTIEEVDLDRWRQAVV